MAQVRIEHVFKRFGPVTVSYTHLRLGDFLIVIAFASESPAVLNRFQELSTMHETVAPHLPLFPGDETVSFDWLQQHQQELQQVYDNLADDWSRDVFAASLNYKLSGKLHYLWPVSYTHLRRCRRNRSGYATVVSRRYRWQ